MSGGEGARGGWGGTRARAAGAGRRGGAREVLGDVEQHRPRPPGRGDVEGLVHVLGDLARVGDLERVLDEGQGGAEDVGLLEAVGADQLGPHLAGDEDGRDRVHHRVGDRRHQVGRAGPGGRKGDPNPTRGLGIALGRVPPTLLVPYLDVAGGGVGQGGGGGEGGAPGGGREG